MQHQNKVVTSNQSRSINSAYSNASQAISKRISTVLNGVEKEVASRTYKASNELRNASLYVLRGSRSGRRYRIPNTKQTYKASAPGESPAARTGMFRLSWGTRVRLERSGRQYRAVAAIESRLKVKSYLLAELLENGTSRMSSRPYKKKIIEKAKPRITEIYSSPYKIK